MLQTKSNILLYNPANIDAETLINDFVIRKNEFQRIIDDLRTSKMKYPEQHYIIQGQRGYGKTTLLLRIYYEIKKELNLSSKFLPILFAEEQYSIRTLEKLWEHLSDRLEEEPSFEGISKELEKYENQDDYEQNAFKTIENYLKKHNKKLILFIDNIGDMFNKFKAKENQRLREIFLTSAEIRIIGASSDILEHTSDYSKPFYEFFEIISLKGLDKTDTEKILLKMSEKLKEEERKNVEDIIKNDFARVEALRRITGGVPRTIALLFEIFIDSKDGNSFFDLETILDRVTPLYKHRMDDLSPIQQEITEVIALNWDAVSTKLIAEKTKLESKSVSAQLNELEKRNIIQKIETSKKNNLYQISERFFNIWYLMRYGRKKDRAKVQWLVEFLNIWCDKDELSKRAKKHLEAIKEGTLYKNHAYYMTEALIRTDIDIEIQDSLIKSAKAFFEKKDKNLAETLSNSDKDIIKEINVFFKNEDFEKVFKLIDKIKNNNEKNSFFSILTIDLFKKGKYEQLENFLLKLLDSGDNRAFNNLGVLYDKQGKYDKAEEFYFKAINSGDNMALINLGVLYNKQGKYDKAEEFYFKAINNGDNRALMNLGVLYYEQGYYNEAENFLLKLLDSGDNRAFNNLGVLYDKQEKYDKAEEFYFKAINSGDNMALMNLGALYDKQEKYDKAEEFYFKAINSGDDIALMSLGALYSEQGKYEKAEEFFLKAINNGDNRALMNLGVLYDKQEKYDKAEKFYLEAINTEDNRAFNNLGVLYDKQGKYDKAEKFFLKAIDNDINEAFNNLGVLYDKQEKYDKAEEFYFKSINSGDDIALMNLGALYSEQGKYDKAEEFFLKAIDNDINEAFNNLSLLYLEQKINKLKALELSQKAYDNGKNIFYSYFLSICLLWNNKPEEAIEIGKKLFEQKETLEAFENYIVQYLLLLISKKQYNYTYKLFNENPFDLKDRFKPIYYALLFFMQDKYPDEYKKMGGELKETVEEIINKINQFAIDYK